jgi:hypothetical protein
LKGDKLATRQQALKAIQAVGVKLDEQIADCGTYILDAPEGKIFNANAEASYLAGVYDREDARIGFGPKMSEIYDDIIMACHMGIVDGVGSED